MMNTLIDEIAAYFDYLETQHGDYVSFHNRRIPMNDYMFKLAPYNISRCPFCLYVKSSAQVWDRCIAHQKKVFEACGNGEFSGTCYAGIGEYVFPIYGSDHSVLGYVSSGGHGIQREPAFQKMAHFAETYGFGRQKLKRLYLETARPEEDPETLRARMAPLTRMFQLLYMERKELEDTAGSAFREYDRLSMAIVYIRKNCARKITVEDIAGYCHCSVSALSHLFKKQTGMSVPQYIGRIRMERAEKLLRKTELDITQISDLLGYCNPGYFSEAFKTRFGRSPKAYRQISREEAGIRRKS